MSDIQAKQSLKQQMEARRGSTRSGTPALPLVIQGARDTEAVAWARDHRGEIDEHLRHHGAILFRGFAPLTVAAFEEFVQATSSSLMDYSERSSPRSLVEGKVFTSTDYPSQYEIFLHNENSYAHIWPLKIYFYCAIPPSEGGETPLADVRRVYTRLRPETREKFERLNILYVRNFSETLGLSWQTAFQTRDRSRVAESLSAAGYDFEWRSDGNLRSRRIGQAVARRPVTGEVVWFNHAAFFHVSTLADEIRNGLLTLVGEEGLPNNTYYGDGSPIEPGVLDELREAYRSEKVMFPWQANDVLMVDNMAVAHARSPYQGERKILVALSEPFDSRHSVD